MNRAADKVIIVTGGAMRIGESTCFLLAQHGAKIAVTDINNEKGKKREKVANQINANLLAISQ